MIGTARKASDGTIVETTLGQQAAALSHPVVLASDQSAVASGDSGPTQTVTRTVTTSADMTVAADLSAAPTATEKILVLDAIISTDTAMTFSIQEETSGTVFARFYLAATSTIQITPRGYLKTAVADKKVQGIASVAGNVSVTLIYTSEA